MSNRERFKIWMKNHCDISDVTQNKYYGAINTNSKDLEKENKEDIDIYNIDNVIELDKVIGIYKSIPKLLEKNKRGNQMYSAAFSMYRKFLDANEGRDKIIIENTENEKEEIDVINIELSIEDIISNLIKYINNKGFIYTKEDLSNFYLSLRTKPFVILAGISGTGKSKLVELFAETIDAKYELISVRPDWNDSTELLGYKNIKDEFVKGRLYEIIEKAIDNPSKPYFVCLDEMNLARVEYYLSDYLSVVESRKMKDGKIVTKNLFSDKYLEDSSCKNIGIPENLYIIGTVNMDDTTFAFSRKVLDRANTIEFSEVDLENLDFLECDSEPINGIDNSFLKTSFLNIKDTLVDEANREYVKTVNNKIVEINNILKSYSKHFGYRVRDEIVFYMLENNIAGLLDEDMAFDYQIMQKILPTIIGSDLCIKEILLKLLELCKNNYDSTEYKYKRSAEKIVQMLKGYEDGFVSFWQ